MESAEQQKVEDENTPWYEHEDCEDCRESDEELGIEYESHFKWENGCWICEDCGQPQ